MRIDLTCASNYVMATSTAGLSGALQKLVWPLGTSWAAASALVMLYDQYYQPSWRTWLFSLLFAAFTPIAAGTLFLMLGLARARTLPDSVVPGLVPPDTFRHVMTTTTDFARRQAMRFGLPRRPASMWLNLAAASAIVPVLWLAWSVLDRHPSGSLWSKILTGGFIVTGLCALVQALVGAHVASRPSFVYHRALPGAELMRWALLVQPLAVMWLMLEAFRTGTVQDFVFSSGTAGNTLASEVASGMTFAVLWMLWIYVVGKSIGPYFTVDELIDRYGGAQITLLRSFKDDEAGVDFGGPVKPDARWRQIRLEPQITHDLLQFGPVVAISGDARTIDRVGARRVQLSDDIWQTVVTRWIDASMMIVMLAGRTPSVRWELETIIARSKVGSLLLLLPPLTTDALGRIENDDKIDRLAIIRDCFDGTPWASALQELEEQGVVGLMLRPGGKLVAITSASSSDEDYRLAVHFAVYCMLCRCRGQPGGHLGRERTARSDASA